MPDVAANLITLTNVAANLISMPDVAANLITLTSRPRPPFVQRVSAPATASAPTGITPLHFAVMHDRLSAVQQVVAGRERERYKGSKQRGRATDPRDDTSFRHRHRGRDSAVASVW